MTCYWQKSKGFFTPPARDTRATPTEDPRPKPAPKGQRCCLPYWRYKCGYGEVDEKGNYVEDWPGVEGFNL